MPSVMPTTMIKWHPVHLTRELYREDGSRHPLAGKHSDMVIVGMVDNKAAFWIIRLDGRYKCTKGLDVAYFGEYQDAEVAKLECRNRMLGIN